jgi:hypothetical protein
MTQIFKDMSSELCSSKTNIEFHINYIYIYIYIYLYRASYLSL